MTGLIQAVLAVTALFGTDPIETHTSTRDVRDCASVDGGTLAATDGGLVWVDDRGRAGAPLTRFDGLPETRVYTIEPVADSTNAWWIGTEGGLAKLERRADALRVTASWSAAPVRAVVEHDGRVLLGTWGAGVLELTNDQLVAIPGPNLEHDDRVTALLVHADAVVAASAGAGAWIVDAKPTPIDGVEGVVWSLASHDGTLYAGTLTGVRRLDGPRSITVSQHDARALASVGDQLWIGSRGQGLVGLDGGPLSALAGLDLTHVQGLGSDGDRDPCIATTDGLWIHPGRRWIPALDQPELPSNDVTATLAVGDALWVGTFEHGIAVLRDGRWQPAPDPDHVLDPQINALASAGADRVWVATTRGLHRVGPNGVESWTTKSGLPHANVLSLAPLRSGELLVGTHAGVAIVDAHGDVRALGRRAREWATWAVAEGPDGALWLGTTQGLIHWKPDGHWDHYSMLSGHLADNWVTALLFEGEALHVGSYAGGVSSFEHSHERGWTATQLGGGRVNPAGLALVGGRLVAATMKGALVRHGRDWVPLGEALFEDVTSALETDAGLWIASRRGLVLHARPDMLPSAR